ncbi:hypothetical protein [Labrys neptuniae]
MKVLIISIALMLCAVTAITLASISQAEASAVTRQAHLLGPFQS